MNEPQNTPNQPSPAEPIYFHVETAETSFTWIGGELKPSTAGKVWLYGPGGEPVLEVPAAAVKRSSRAEVERRLLADVRQAAERGATRN